MLQRAIYDVGDDFHVAMRVHSKAHLGRNVVFIDHPQVAEVGLLRIIIIGEAEGVVGIEPAVLGVASFVGFAYLDHNIRWLLEHKPNSLFFLMVSALADHVLRVSLPIAMSAFPYRLAVFDMDDTLLGPNRQISRENVEALHRLRAMNVEVVIASGRHFKNIAEFEAALGFKGWIISAGGAVVSHAETQEMLYEETVPQEMGLQLFHRVQGQDISVITYHRSGIFCGRAERVGFAIHATHAPGARGRYSRR